MKAERKFIKITFKKKMPIMLVRKLRPKVLVISLYNPLNDLNNKQVLRHY